jgi:hypothetical protein
MANINNWARIDVGVLNDHIAKITEPGMRKHVMLAMLRKRGRITYRHAGKGCDWRTKFRRRKPVPYDDMQARSFPRVNRYKEASLPWRAYSHSEGFSKYERLVSKAGPTRLIDIVGNIVEDMGKDFNEQFHLELYNDGDASGYDDRMHGLESIFSVSGAVTNSAAAAPNDTYAGLSTTLGNYGGSWTGETSNGYPTGTGDLEYHFFSPLVVDYTSAVFGANTATWPYQWRPAMRYAAMYQDNLHGKSPDIFLMSPELLRQARDSIEDKERILVPSDNEVCDLGFKALRFEGIDMMSEYGCTTGACYGLYWDGMEYRALEDQIFKTERDEDITTLTTQLGLDAWGNMIFESPAYQTKLQSGTS